MKDEDKILSNCSKCNVDISYEIPDRRGGRCDKCWIVCLENSVNIVASNIVDNSGDTLEMRRGNIKQTFWGWRYAIAAQFALNLLDMIGSPDDLQIKD